MKKSQHCAAAVGLATLLALSGCADMNTPGSTRDTSTSYPQSTHSQTKFGVVQSIDLVRSDDGAPGGSNPGIGSIAGAVVGGLLGNQVGGGSGNTAATVIGVAGGAYAGHQLEKRNQSQLAGDAFKLTVRLNDGSYQSVTQTSNADIRVGDRVQIDNGVVRRY
jgi:outer membrane lipoprotein SlyB